MFFIKSQSPLKNQYQYNGKELNEYLGLNLNDYGARWCDASIGRFHVIDRFAEKSYTMTPLSMFISGTLEYFKLKEDRELFLLQGINFYCNGMNCTSYEIIILQKQNDKLFN